MLQAGPEVHGNGTELNLHPHISLAVGKENRHLHNQVKASISVRLGIGYIILLRDQPDIILLHQHSRQCVDIVREGTNHADTRNIIQILFYVFH